jgi:pilus assembly protein CpaB
MIKRQSLIAIGVAVVLGLVAVYLANIFLSAGRGNEAPEGTVKVAVAAVPMNYGTELTPEKVRFIDYPAHVLPAGSFSNASQLLSAGKRRVVLTAISANEPILAGKITGPGQSASIAALLPDGKRAAAVRINDVSGVGGFIKPNDSVDVLITREAPGNGNSNNSQLTDVLLKSVRVLALDQEAANQDGNQDGKPAVAKTATLEVTPIDAQKLALGQQVGEISLVLRNPGTNDDDPFVQTVSLEDLRYGRYGSSNYARPIVRTGAPAQRTTRATAPRPRPVRRPAQPPAAAPKPANNVEVVRGTTGTNYNVGDLRG